MSRREGRALLDALQAGRGRLEADRREVDRLNVFPVPDGDTGGNLCMTLQAAVERAERQAQEDAGLRQVARALAAGALEGARGNSGVILSQLLRGFSDSLETASRLTPAVLADALDDACAAAYRAVADPVEGTILSVARAAAAGARAGLAVQPKPEWRRVLRSMMEAAAEALDRTPEQLPALRRAGVVDAGGLGLLRILEGAAGRILDGGDPGERAVRAEAASGSRGAAGAAPPLPGDPSALRVFQESIPYPYDLEFRLVAPGLTREELEQALAGLGDSLVISEGGAGEPLKVHIHARDLGPVFSYACSRGELIDLHLVNMRQQAAAVAAGLPSGGDAVRKGVAADREGPAAADRGVPAGMDRDAPPAADREEPAGTVCVAVAAAVSGEGFAALFRRAGADAVLSLAGTGDVDGRALAEAVRGCGDRDLLLLPNSRTARATMTAAADDAAAEGRRAAVIPTENMLEGLAVLEALDRRSGLAGQLPALRAAAGSLRTGCLRAGAAAARPDGDPSGPVQGWIQGALAVEGGEEGEVLAALVGALLEQGEERVLLAAGAGVAAPRAEAAAEAVRRRHPELEVELVAGGQADSLFLVGVE